MADTIEKSIYWFQTHRRPYVEVLLDAKLVPVRVVGSNGVAVREISRSNLWPNGEWSL